MSLLSKIRSSITIRLSLVFSLVFVAMLVLIYLSVVPQLENNLTEQKQTELGNYATLFSESFLAAQNQGASPVYLDLLTQQYAERADARILFMDGAGNLLADSLKGQAFEPADYTIAKRAIAARTPLTEVVNLSDGRKYAMAAVPVGSGNRVVGVIVVSQSMSAVESAVLIVKRLIAVAAVGGFYL
jgi:hypothetical protein